MYIPRRHTPEGGARRLTVPARQPADMSARLPRALLPAVVRSQDYRRDFHWRPVRPVVTFAVTAPEIPLEILEDITIERRKLALLLPGHNEELIIAETIKSAIRAGQSKEDIFVVDDASTDATRQIAVALLGEDHVLSVERSGKAMAVQQAIDTFNLIKDYEWLHVADADSIFSPDYFEVYRSKLDSEKYAVAVGFVQSMRGNWISTYRALTYTYSQHITRRLQARLGMISVFPGPITAFRTDILAQLDFTGDSLTEDFDVTLQVHRNRLGRIAFIPGAINYTQDPQSLRDFCKQNLRWQRGFFQGVRKYKIGRQRQKIDVSLGFQMFQTFFFVFQLGFLLPYLIIQSGSWMTIPIMIAVDIILTSAIAIVSSFAIRRWNLIGSLPYFYFLHVLEVLIYFVAFFEVMVLRRFKGKAKGWQTEGRRYRLSNAALADVRA